MKIKINEKLSSVISKMSLPFPPLPSDIEALESQVAGHQFSDGKNAIGMLKQKDGIVLKPVIKILIGEREISFYEHLQISTDPVLNELRELVPKYYGTKVLKLADKDITFIKLQNIIQEFHEPCVMDIKIGKRTWDPLATDLKIEREKKKYEKTKNILGFCITGFQYVDVTTGVVKKYDKNYGKKMDIITLKNALKEFFNGNLGLKSQLMDSVLFQLHRILKWCSTQKKLRLYSSSILLVYDAYCLKQFSKECIPNLVLDSKLNVSNSDKLTLKCDNSLQRVSDKSNSEVNKSNVELSIIKMIDFAHAFNSEEDKVDENYLEGITSLINVLENLRLGN